MCSFSVVHSVELWYVQIVNDMLYFMQDSSFQMQ